MERSALQAGEGGDVNGTETPPESLGDPEGWLDLADVLAESLENLFVKILMEGFAELADANAFPAGQIVRFAYKVSQPRLTVPIRAYGNDSVEVRLQAAITLDGPLLDLDVRRQGDQPAPTAPPDHQPQPNGHWPLKYFWIESHLPCAVAVLSRTTLRDLTGLPRLSAEGFAAQVERTETIATPYALGLIIPDARLAVLGLRPARRKRAGFTELVQLDRHTRTVNRWTVTG